MTGFISVFASEAPNGKFIPSDPKEFWWGLASFLIVFGLLAWKVFPLFKNILANRADKIEGELASADQAQATAQAEMADLRAKLGDADAEAARIVAAAESNAVQLKADLAQRAADEAAAMRARATSDIESARRQAQADLEAEIGLATLSAAEEVVRTNLDDATQTSLIESYIEQVGAS